MKLLILLILTDENCVYNQILPKKDLMICNSNEVIALDLIASLYDISYVDV